MKLALPLVIFMIANINAGAQQWMVAVDSANKSILTNAHVQFEANEAIDDMYNFNFSRARSGFNTLKKQYGWHPLPYFLDGLNYWWQIVPNFSEEKYDAPFSASMDTAILLAKRLYNEINQVEGAFFLAAAYAFKGRLYSDRGKYMQSAWLTRQTLKYLSEVRGKESYSPELLFGDGLFNYYSVWIRENYPTLKPLMAFFPKGDKQLGIEQLREVASNGFYSRIEAQYYLMRILTLEEKDLEGGTRIANYLHSTYPNNAYFHRFYNRTLYLKGDYQRALVEAQEILMKIDSGYVGYEAYSGRYAAFFLGHINEMAGKYDKAIAYFKMCLDFSEKTNATKKGYYFYSLLHLGKIWEKKGDYDFAEEYFLKVKKATKKKNTINKTARRKLVSIKKKRKGKVLSG